MSGASGEERTRRVAAEDWRQTFDAIHDLILLLDREGRVYRLNRAARERLDGGLEATLSDLLGARGAALVEEAKDGEEVLLAALGGAFEVSVYPMTDPDGSEGGRVVILSDVTEKARLREQLIHSEKLSALGELISGIAHELNNPLTAVLGYAQIIEMSDDDRFAREIAHLKEESLRASRIVRNLLTFSRRAEPKQEPVDLNEIIRRTLALREYDLRVHDIELEQDLAPDLPRSMMDHGQIQQVLLNLVNNAEFAIQSGRKCGRIRITSRAESGRILFEVEDDGPGLSEGARDRVFEPFFTTKPKGKGTGLGLSICYGLVRDHGGEIRLDADYRNGCRFVVDLPVVSWRLDPPPDPDESSCQDTPPVTRRLRILFVDDEPSVRSIGEEFLRGLGHRVTVAENGLQALRRLEEQEYDLVFCDLLMPRIGGLEVYHRTIERDPAYRLRFAFVTGAVDAVAIVEGTDASLLTKPFDLEDLRRVVGELAVA